MCLQVVIWRECRAARCPVLQTTDQKQQKIRISVCFLMSGLSRTLWADPPECHQCANCQVAFPWQVLTLVLHGQALLVGGWKTLPLSSTFIEAIHQSPFLLHTHALVGVLDSSSLLCSISTLALDGCLDVHQEASCKVLSGHMLLISTTPGTCCCGPGWRWCQWWSRRWWSLASQSAIETSAQWSILLAPNPSSRALANILGLCSFLDHGHLNRGMWLRHVIEICNQFETIKHQEKQLAKDRFLIFLSTGFPRGVLYQCWPGYSWRHNTNRTAPSRAKVMQQQ